MLIPNAKEDPRFANNPQVTGPTNIQFYAGVPLKSSSGSKLGAFCILDTKERNLKPLEIELLHELAQIAEDELNQIELIKANQKLQSTTSSLKALIEASPAAIVMYNADGIIEVWNRAAETMFKWKAEEVINKPLPNFTIGINDPIFDIQLEKEMGQHIDTIRYDKQGNSIEVNLSIGPIVNAEGKIIGGVQIIHDITNRKKIERALQFQAQHDLLTGLPNRATCIHVLSEAIERAKVNKKNMALMFLDVDYFKSINDKLGHDEGDSLLKQFSNRLSQNVRSIDMVARLAGDEFIILFEGVDDNKENLNIIIDKILQSMSLPFTLNKEPYYVTTSIGVTFYNGGDETAETLLKQADIAMYKAKQKGRNRFEFYTQ
ncbi:MAG: hypothetical protein JWM09_1574 [Francisellaceae bacterium]|nr:hypothetical protein [Francisellaceae bacterium]